MNGKKKKLMLLGGLRYLIPVIKKAHELGVYVITVDYLPDNIAHKYSDEYHNVSILDKEAVLNLAKDLNIDGIMSFAVDPGVVTAAYVAEKLNLPFQGSYESVKILQNKGEFRKFLQKNGFNVPYAKDYATWEEAIIEADSYNWPVIVKPVDSAGSKGVRRVDTKEELKSAVDEALNNSFTKRFIIEEFIEKEGDSSDSDCFTIGGQLAFCSFSNQKFDERAANPYTPSGFVWPSRMPLWAQMELRSELQRLMLLLNIKSGIFNVETRLGKDGKTYIMEVSPRGGGNRLAEMLDLATGSKLIENSIKAALGEAIDFISEPKFNGYLYEEILHSDRTGIFRRIEIDSSQKPYLLETDLWVKEGDIVNKFSGANHTIGTLVFKYDEDIGLKMNILQMKNVAEIMIDNEPTRKL